MNKCRACDSTSVIQDGKVWVCAAHIETCKCEKDHSKSYEWDFNKSRSNSISITIESMERESPDVLEIDDDSTQSEDN